jgi:hypothetical protein
MPFPIHHSLVIHSFVPTYPELTTTGRYRYRYRYSEEDGFINLKENFDPGGRKQPDKRDCLIRTVHMIFLTNFMKLSPC